MNLKTHTVYPEIQVGEDFSWTAKLIKSNGTVAQEFDGEAATRAEATAAARVAIDDVEDLYLVPVTETAQ